MFIFIMLQRKTVCCVNVCQLKIPASPKHADCDPEKRILMPKKAGISYIYAHNGGVGLDFTIIYRFPDITGYDRPVSFRNPESLEV